MKLRHLRCFHAVSEKLNFMRTAERLHINEHAFFCTLR